MMVYPILLYVGIVVSLLVKGEVFGALILLALFALLWWLSAPKNEGRT